MYYKDLTKYEYINDGLDAVNIGWLEFGHHFEKGEVSKEVLDRLKRKEITRRLRGFQECSLCTDGDFKKALGENKRFIIPTGCGEIITKGNYITYSSPELLIHYIEKHEYKPPDIFLRDVLNEN